jgi:hypothetical protein
MNIKKIKKGVWYKTKLGNGPCVSVGETHPPSIQIHIRSPIPRGICNLTPRDVIAELSNPLDEKQPESRVYGTAPWKGPAV